VPRIITMIKFLQWLYEKNKASILTTTTIMLAANGSVWKFDLRNLTQTGVLDPKTLWQSRILLTLILLIIYAFLAVLITLVSYKKDYSKYFTNTSQMDKEMFSELAKILESIPIQIPSFALNGGPSVTNNLYSIFINIQNSLVTGITNRAGQHEGDYWLYNTICPKLQIHGMVQKEKVDGSSQQIFSITKKGLDFLAYIDKKKLIKK
jgi:hypothetical protein